MDPIRLDFGNLMAPLVDGGVDPALLAGQMSGAFRQAHAVVEERRAAGDLGFLDLPYATESVDRVRELADGFAQWFEDVVVLGIGDRDSARTL